MINARAEHLEMILAILREHAADCQVRAFGSRVTGTPKSYSDLDIALVGKDKLSIGRLGEICDAFQESDLPFRVDVLDWNMISAEFKEVIEKGYEVLQEAKDI